MTLLAQHLHPGPRYEAGVGTASVLGPTILTCYETTNALQHDANTFKHPKTQCKATQKSSKYVKISKLAFRLYNFPSLSLYSVLNYEPTNTARTCQN